MDGARDGVGEQPVDAFPFREFRRAADVVGLPHTHRARNRTELAAETRRFLHRRRRQPHIITGSFKAPHVRHTHDE